MRLIDADKLKERLLGYKVPDEPIANQAHKELIYAIDSLPTVCDIEQIRAEIYEHFMTIDGGVHDKSALKCMEIIDKYKASEEISERNMKMWEEIFKAESEDKK